MKKIKPYGIILILSFIGFSQIIYAGTMNMRPLGPGPIIRFNIDLSSKKSNCMNPFGFCQFSIEIEWEDHANPNGLLPARAYLNKSNQLVILIKETDLHKYRHGQLIPYLKGKTTIKIDDTYSLGPEVNRALEAKTPIIIKEGEYPVSFTDGEYTITITL